MTSHSVRSLSSRGWFLVSWLVLLASCTPPVERPTGWAAGYKDVTDTFSKADYQRAIEFSDPIVSASPANEYTNKSLVLRAVIYSGEVSAYKELQEAYTKGIQAAKNPTAKEMFERARTDYRQYGTRVALGLADTALKLTKGDAIPKDLALEATYPSVEGPTEVEQLARVREGAPVGAEDQDAAVRDAIRKGVDDALARLAGGDRSKARSTFRGTAVPLNDLDFALFLDHELGEAGTLFDTKHGSDPIRLKLVCDQGDRVTNIALALLKANPDKAKEKDLKKIQDQFKTLRKSL